MNRSSSKHPISNGLVERLNAQIHQKLRAFGASHDNWDQYLPLVEAALNFTVHSRLNLSPFHIVFGVPPRWGINNLLSGSDTNAALPRHTASEKSAFNQLMQNVQHVRDDIREKRDKARAVYEKYYNCKNNVTQSSYVNGDLVYLRKNDVRPSKLAVLYDGPFIVKKVYESDKFGQLLRLADVQTGTVLSSLMHPDRIKPAYSYMQHSESNTTDPLVELNIADNQPARVVVNFEHFARKKDDAKENDNADQNSTNDVDRKKSES